MRSLVSLGVYLLSAGLIRAEDVNEWPIIGIYTHPSTDTNEACGGSCSYLAASYVKYLESAGARVAPIPYEASTEELDVIFNGINGMFFPGGGAMMSDGAKYMYERAITANDAGDYFPIWGTCLGFEWLMMATSHNDNILDSTFDSEDYSIPLNFTNAVRDSRLFAGNKEIVSILATEPVTFNAHMAGIAADHFERTQSLSSFYRVISTNNDRVGWEFISTVEAYEYPIYGSQWHPEKNIFEWGQVDGEPYETINHSPDAVKIAQYTANFFVQEARKNFHKFQTPEEEDAHLIYNYTPTKTGPKFVQDERGSAHL
jgi:gamma-glutamyl hydrolase